MYSDHSPMKIWKRIDRNNTTALIKASENCQFNLSTIPQK